TSTTAAERPTPPWITPSAAGPTRRSPQRHAYAALPAARPMRTARSMAVKAYVELPRRSESARVHAISKIMATAPEMPMAAGISHAAREARASIGAWRAGSGVGAVARRVTLEARAAAARLAAAAVHTVARFPREGRRK